MLRDKISVKKLILPLILVSVTLLLIIIPAVAGTRKNSAKASVLSAAAEKTTVNSTLSGAGTLSQETPINVSVPNGVRIKEFLVKNGDVVSSGDALAVADRVSVMKTITQTQSKLEGLSKQIEAALGKKISSKITAGAAGRVMKVYAQKGQSVDDVMLQYGALALISLDGKLAVNISTNDKLSTGKSVVVVLSNGKKKTGMVEKCVNGEAVITVSDNGTTPGDSVTVKNQSGSVLGEGELYIHSELKVTGFSGKISKVNVKAGKTVKKNTVLFNMTSLDYEAEYERLCAERRVYEDNMAKLFKMYQTQLVTAENDGYVIGIDKNDTILLSSKGGSETVLLSNAPNGDDSQIYVNYIGKLDSKKENELTLKMSQTPLLIADYKTVNDMNIPEEQMTSTVKFTPDPDTSVFVLSGGAWYKGSVSGLSKGDTLLFSYDMTGTKLIWIVKVNGQKKAEENKDKEDKSPSDKPASGNKDDNKPKPGQNAGGQGGFSNKFPSGSGHFSAGGSYPKGASSGESGAADKASEQAAKPKEESEIVIMSVVPTNSMSLEVTIDELDILYVAQGQKALITVDALPSRSFEGEVTAVDIIADNNGGNSKYTVTLTLARSEDMLDGMNAEALITLESKEEVLTVPVAALSDMGRKTVVYTQYDKSKGFGEACYVETGISDGEKIEILSGLDEGVKVWYEYYEAD